MRIPSIIWVILVLVVGGGFLAFLVSDRNNKALQNVKLPIQVEVFVDYNCPHCAAFEPYIIDTKNTYGDKVNIQTKNLPFLAESSTIYAQAAEAARLQNKFDDYSLALFKWHEYLSNPNNTIFTYTDDEKQFFSQQEDVDALAQRLGLDTAKFSEDMDSQTIKDLVQSQKADAVKRLGTQSTPAIFVFGELFQPNTQDDFKAHIGDLITAAEKNQQ